MFSTQPGGWDPEPFDLPGLYAAIREAAPGTLVSFKNGVTGTEDFVAPELYYDSHGEGAGKPGDRRERVGLLAETRGEGFSTVQIQYYLV